MFTRIAVHCAILVLGVPMGCAESPPPALPTWSLGPAQPLSIPETSPYSLGNVRWVAVTGSGDAFVLDGLSRRVVVLDSTGRVKRAFGQQGGGPGEFESPMMLGRWGDSVWVLDLRLRRVTIFDTAGTLGRTIPIHLEPTPYRVSTPIVSHLLADGSLLINELHFRTSNTDRSVTPLHLQRLDPQTNALTPLGRYETMPPWIVRDDRGMENPQAQPFAAGALYDVATDGSAMVFVEQPEPTDHERGRYTVTKVAATGDTIYSREYAYRPEPLTGELVDSVARTRAPDAPNGLARAKAYLSVPRYVAYAQQALLAMDGSVWIGRGPYPIRSWEVINPEGERVAQVALPEGYLWESDGTLVWMSAPNSNDVPVVTRYALHREPRHAVAITQGSGGSGR